MAVCQARIPRADLARSSLATFVERFPSSPRLGEASAMLGWILLDLGDVDGAARQFSVGARDRVDDVRRSARAGLEQVRARRHSSVDPVPTRH
jgi:TolA-binding protein